MEILSFTKARAVYSRTGSKQSGWRRWWLLLVLLAVAFGPADSARAARQKSPSPEHPFLKLTPNDEPTRKGFDYFYNMEYEPAIADFEKSLSTHPNDPYAVNHLLEGVLFQELHREGKLDAELYLSNEFVHAKKVKPDPEAISRVHDLVQRALNIEDRELAANPNDTRALYARSVTRGLRATKEALVDKAWFTALRSGLGAYDDSKRVLALDPADSDAKLIVGIYNYVVGSLPWLVKIAAFLATIHGSRTKGLALIRAAVEGGGEASVDARTTLGLFLARDHHYAEALKLTEWLYAAFPRNFLYGVSVADLLKSNGEPQKAAHAYRQLIELGKQGRLGNQDVGLAAMDLGNLLRSEKNWRGAANAYDLVETLPHSDPALVMHARLAAGQMYDLAGERQLAVKRYREVAQGASDKNLAQKARLLLEHPYRANGGN